MRPSVGQPGGYHPDSDVEASNCCICLHCREMPTGQERDFQTIMLDEGVLTLARKMRRKLLIYDDEISEVSAFRHSAYRQFILWMYGHLGAGDV
ncbi:positive regulation of bleb assembly [Mactra antiquata]